MAPNEAGKFRSFDIITFPFQDGMPCSHSVSDAKISYVFEIADGASVVLCQTRGWF